MANDDKDLSQEAKVAVAVNDIEWLKESQNAANAGIEHMQATLEQHIKNQNERAKTYATKADLQEFKEQELKPLVSKVDKHERFQNKLLGAISLGAVVATACELLIRFVKF